MLRNLDIDRLRAIAIIAVLANHGADLVEFVGGRSSLFLSLLKQGAAGVDLFFVISGFIVSSVIVPKINRLHQSQNSKAECKSFLGQFYIKRLFRLLPAAWTVLGIFLIVDAFLYGTQSERFHYSWANALAAVLYSANYFLYFNPPPHYSMNIFGHYWSLAIEEQFYFIFPLFLILIRSARLKMVILSLTLVFLVFFFRPILLPLSVTNLRNEAIATFASHFRADGIIAGCLLYLFLQTSFLKNFSPPLMMKNPLISIFVTAIIFLGAMVSRCIFPFTINIPIVVFLSCILVYLASFNQNLIAGGSKYDLTLQWFGSRSYSLYLINWPLLWGLHRLMTGDSLQPTALHTVTLLVSWILATLLLGECLYRYVECPMQKLGHVFLRSHPQNQAQRSPQSRQPPNEIPMPVPLDSP